MSHANTIAKPNYREAIEVTQEIEAPALGFVRPAEYIGASASKALIKQNNTIIQLLVQIAEQLDKVEERIQVLEGKKRGDISSDLVEKLEQLSLGKGVPVAKEVKGSLRVFKDPQLIFAEVKAREEARWQK